MCAYSQKLPPVWASSSQHPLHHHIGWGGAIESGGGGTLALGSCVGRARVGLMLGLCQPEVVWVCSVIMEAACKVDNTGLQRAKKLCPEAAVGPII